MVAQSGVRFKGFEGLPVDELRSPQRLQWRRVDLPLRMRAMRWTHMLDLVAGDRRVLRMLGPLFMLLTASTVVTMSCSKALYIGHNSYASLPFMFIGAATFTAAASLAYVQLMGRWRLEQRFIGLLVLAIVSFGILGVVLPMAPERLSLFVFAWCTGIGQLLLIQAWTYSTTTLPVRQARRLFPVLAACATVGAVVGGSLTAAILPFGELGSLLFLAVLLLFGALLVVVAASRSLQEATSKPGREDAGMRVTPGRSSAARPGRSGVLLALRDLRTTPLMRDLALLAIFLQVASVTMDLQFSAALKNAFDTESMASFLGSYYAVANLVTFFLALMGGRRIARMVGIGFASGSAATVLLIGSIVGVFLIGSGATAVFWGVVMTSFGERIMDFGVGKHAFNAALTPVDARAAERVKFLIDGVGLRFATIAVSLVFILGSVELSHVAGLTPFVGLTALVALFFAWRLTPTYRRTLLEALRSNQLEPVDAKTYRAWARREAQLSLERLLTSGQVTDIMAGLAVCEEFKLPLAKAWRTRILAHDDLAVVVRCLQVAADLDEPMAPEELTHLLGDERPVRVLREALRNLKADARECVPWVERLADHADPLVACQSLIWLRPHRRAGTEQERAEIKKRLRWTHIERRVVGSQEPESLGSRGEAIVSRLHDYLVKLPSLLSSDDKATADEALSAVSALRTPLLLDSLLDAVDSPETGHAATMALTRIGRDVVESKLIGRLASPVGVRLAQRIRLIRLAELIGSTEGVIGQLDAEEEQVRDAAVDSLWRLARQDENSLPSREVIVGQALADISELVQLAQIDALLDPEADSRLGFFRHEVALRRCRGERRVFRLLGLIYGRRLMLRAYTHCRSEFPRTRSNAVEMLDEAITDKSLQKLVNYVEASRFSSDKSFTNDASHLPLEGAMADAPNPLQRMLPAIDHSLANLYRWATQPERPPRTEDPMNRVFLLHSIPLFNSTPADQLLAISQICHEASYAAGEVVFEPGEPASYLYLIEKGRIEILRNGRPVTSFGPSECFGELAILDDASRNVTSRAVEDTDCLIINREDFQGLLAISPDLARGTIATLTRRLRTMLQRSG